MSEGAPGIEWVGARDAAQPPGAQDSPPTENDLALNVCSASVEEPNSMVPVALSTPFSSWGIESQRRSMTGPKSCSVHNMTKLD